MSYNILNHLQIAPDGSITIPGDLEVTGTLTNNGGPVQGGGGGGGQWSLNSSDIYFSTGNVGIGTTSPNKRLDVRDDDDTAYSTLNHGPEWTAMLRNNKDEVAGRFAGLAFQSASPAGGYATGWIGVVSKDKVGDMVFGIRDEDGSAKDYHETMRITSDGNVGIGTDSPVSNLHVEGTGCFNRNTDEATGWTTVLAIRNDNPADDISMGLDFQAMDANDVLRTAGRISSKILSHNQADVTSRLCFSSHGSFQEQMVIDSDGNVGIGTDSPSAKLDVKDDPISSGADLSPIKIFSLRRPNVSAVTYGQNVNFFVSRFEGSETAGISTQARTQLDIALSHSNGENGEVSNVDGTNERVGGTQVMSLRSDGNVGIGTDSPTNRLSVVDDSADTNTETSIGCYASFLNENSGLGTGFALVLGSNSNQGTAIIGQLTGDGNNEHCMKFQTRNDQDHASTKMTILGDGNVGIGTDSPSAQLDVSTGVNGMPNTDVSEDAEAIALRLCGEDNAVMDFGVNGGAATWIQARNKAENSLEYPLILNPNGGNVGIGTVSPAEKLHIDGALRLAHNNAPQVSGAAGAGTIWWNNTITPHGKFVYRDGNGDNLNLDGGAINYNYTGTVWQGTPPGSVGDIYFNQGNVSIGTTSPTSAGHTYMLRVNGPAIFHGDTIDDYGSSFGNIALANQDNSNRIILRNIGGVNKSIFQVGALYSTEDYRVGINTSDPDAVLGTAGLAVEGPAHAKIAINALAGEAQLSFYEDSVHQATIQRISNNFSTANRQGTVEFHNNGADFSFDRGAGGGSNNFTIKSDGKVGINMPVSSVPITALDVKGDSGEGTSTSDGLLSLVGDSDPGGTDNYRMTFGVNAAGDGWIQPRGSSGNWQGNILLGPHSIGGLGVKVGIGTTSPDAKLTIHGGHSTNDKINAHFDPAGANPQLQLIKAGIGRASSLCFLDSLAATGEEHRWSISHGNFSTDADEADSLFINNAGADSILALRQNGNVGIGTATPSSNHLRESVVEIRSPYVPGGSMPGLRLTGNETPGGVETTSWETWLQGSGGSGSNFMISSTRVSGTTGEATTDDRLTINHAGNVGIGTTTPSANLQLGLTPDTSAKVGAAFTLDEDSAGWATWIENKGTGDANSGLYVRAGDRGSAGGHVALFCTNDGESVMTVTPRGTVQIGYPEYETAAGSGTTQGNFEKARLSIPQGSLDNEAGVSYNQNNTELGMISRLGNKYTFAHKIRFDFTDNDPTDQIYYFHLVFRNLTGFKYKAEIGASRVSSTDNTVRNINVGYASDESYIYWEDDNQWTGRNEGEIRSFGDMEIVSTEAYVTDESGAMWGMKALPPATVPSTSNNFIVRYGVSFKEALNGNSFGADINSPDNWKEGALSINVEMFHVGQGYYNPQDPVTDDANFMFGSDAMSIPNPHFVQVA